MNKHNRQSGIKRAQGNYLRWSILAILSVAIGISIYFIAYSKSFYLFVANTYSKTVIWITEHKHLAAQTNTNKEKMKKPIVEGEQPIHFEFYTTLPTMQVKVAEVAKKPIKSAVKISDASELERDLSNAVKGVNK